MECFVIIVNGWLEAVNYYHKALHLGCCSSPRSASAFVNENTQRMFQNYWYHSKTNNIKILQVKWSGVVIMGKSEDIDKCLNMLKNDKFKKVNDNPIKTIESKIQRSVCKVKNKRTKRRIFKNIIYWFLSWKNVWHC